jgi:branched-chain amino acid transport system substrate-binding protein
MRLKCALAVLGVIVAGLLIVVLASCGGGDDENVIKIGVAGPMTGDQARNGEELRLGATLAAEEWNAEGGLLGKKIELVMKDDQALETEAGKVANELIDAGVVAVIGHYNSGVTYPASREYAKRNIPMLTPAATNPSITDDRAAEGYTTVFRVCGRDDVQGETGAEFVADELGLKRVAVLHDKTIYGQGLAEAFKNALEKKGVTITKWQGFDNKERNFRPYIPMLREDDPQLWYFGGIHTQGGPLARQAKEGDVDIPFMSGDGVYHPEFLAKAGEMAEGAYFTFPDIYSTPEAKEFQERYEKRFQKKTGPYSVYSYVTANILFESIAKAGTTDGLDIAKAIRGMEHDTVIGPISFDEKGDVTRSIYTIWTVKDGKFVLYDETK